MATIQECREVVDDLLARLEEYDHETRKKNLPDRTLELKLLDLDTSFRGRLHDGELIDVIEAKDGPKPNIRVVMTSDDLIAMHEGDLKFAHAWATGRVRLDASIRDLLRLRSMARPD